MIFIWHLKAQIIGLFENLGQKAVRGTTDAAWIRFVNKCKVLVALRKFREVIRPYDTRDVIERFNTGQNEMLSK